MYLVDLFCLHQRGRDFSILGIAMNMGASDGPTFSGFITVKNPWYMEYYWTIALTCVAIILVFLLLEETSWNRDDATENVVLQHKSWLQNRTRLFFPGTAVIKKPSRREMVHTALKNSVCVRLA